MATHFFCLIFPRFTAWSKRIHLPRIYPQDKIQNNWEHYPHTSVPLCGSVKRHIKSIETETSPLTQITYTIYSSTQFLFHFTVCVSEKRPRSTISIETFTCVCALQFTQFHLRNRLSANAKQHSVSQSTIDSTRITTTTHEKKNPIKWWIGWHLSSLAIGTML